MVQVVMAQLVVAQLVVKLRLQWLEWWWCPNCLRWPKWWWSNCGCSGSSGGQIACSGSGGQTRRDTRARRTRQSVEPSSSSWTELRTLQLEPNAEPQVGTG